MVQAALPVASSMSIRILFDLTFPWTANRVDPNVFDNIVVDGPVMTPENARSASTVKASHPQGIRASILFA